MAKAQKNGGSTPVVPNFKDVDKAAVQAAQAAVAGGRQDPLVVPASAKVSQSDSATYSRWTERGVVQQAYRSVTKKGLLDVTVIVKIRQSEKNNGRKVFAHFYLNNSADASESHEQMTERSIGAITTLLVATNFMPAGGALKGSVLDKMFPQKGQPGTSSPLVGKPVVANIVQQFSQAKDLKTGKPMVDDEGEKVMEKRDSAETFLPDTGTASDEDGDDEDN